MISVLKKNDVAVKEKNADVYMEIFDNKLLLLHDDNKFNSNQQ